MKRSLLTLSLLLYSCSFDPSGLPSQGDPVCEGEPPLALKQQGVCAGSLQVCIEGGWQEPEYTTIMGYEALEISCDGVDNDCDGVVDAGECGENAACGLVEGAIGCACDEGYDHAGLECVDINECDTGPCDPNAICGNTPGGFTCMCRPGYTGDGFTCTDTDPCDPHPCHPDAACEQVGDSFTCTCSGGFTGDGMSCSPTSCRTLHEAYPATGDGTYVIDTGTGGPLSVHCDMTSDFGTGYTMVRFTDASLAGDQDAYRALCAAHGMEVIVPRTRGHAYAIRRWLGGSYPPLVNVFPKFDGAAGLENFEGICQGQPCSYYLSNSRYSYTDTEPSGNSLTAYSLYLWYDDAGTWGGWDDADNRVDPAFAGSVVCSTNDNPEPPVLQDCEAYVHNQAVWNKGAWGISGTYPINPTGSAQMEAWCDQRMDGGGWTLVLNYVHQGGTNPELSVKSDSLPHISANTLGADESASPLYWGHASNALLSQFAISEVRFYGTSEAGRTIDFVTAHDGCIEYIQTGAGNCRSFEDNYHGLWSQGAYLPRAIDNGRTNKGDYALTDFPFFRTGNYHWGIKGNGNRWEVDSFPNNASHDTIHRVFIRTRPSGTSCFDILANNPDAWSGYYAIDPDGPGGEASFITYCDMVTDGGGWTLVAMYGKGYGRPSSWSGNDYPRPGASFFNSDTDGVTIDPRIFNAANNDGNFPSFSINAATLWANSGREIRAYVGGTTDDWVTAQLPAGCNFFDGTTWCEENTYGPFTLYASNGTAITSDAYACTTAHGNAPYTADPYDEFGLHIQDGFDVLPNLNCANTASTLGHQDIGRLFTTFESSTAGYWDEGVTSHWNEAGAIFQNGALFIR